MKLARWKTDPAWALRRASKKGKLPEDVEKVFNNLDYCFSYAKILNARLPSHLEEVVFNLLKETPDRLIANWLINYSRIVKKLPQKFENLFFKIVKENKDWGADRVLSYFSNCQEPFPEEIENILWQSDSAYTYAIICKKRIPQKYEKERFENFLEHEIINYSLIIFKGRLPENLEALLAEDIRSAVYYAKKIMFGKLPDNVHNALLLKSFENNYHDKTILESYLKFIKESHNYTINALSGFDKTKTVEEVLHYLGKVDYDC
jgi:hypothetical protein